MHAHRLHSGRYRAMREKQEASAPRPLPRVVRAAQLPFQRHTQNLHDAIEQAVQDLEARVARRLHRDKPPLVPRAHRFGGV